MTEHLSYQQIFDEVFDKLWVQGRPSLGIEGCAYRGDGGLKCGIGHIIPDESYYPGLENECVSNRIVLAVIPAQYAINTSFLVSIQARLHDAFIDQQKSFGYQFRVFLNEAGEDFAKLWDLQFTPRKII